METQNATPKQNRLGRELETRETTYRPTAWQLPESLPSPEPREGWTHRWVRISTLGNSDPSNISGKLREGYEPVKADDYPELMMHATTEGRFKGGVEVGGLILCRIPAEFMVQRAAFYANKNKQQMDSVDNTYMQDNVNRMQKFSQKKSEVTFGSGL